LSTDYFSKALSNFTNDIASGDAIRHLADLGYTVNEIHDRLDFPTPHSRIADTVWKHYIATGVIRLEKPDGRPVEKVSYVREYDSLGRAYFKQVREVVMPPGVQSSKDRWGSQDRWSSQEAGFSQGDVGHSSGSIDVEGEDPAPLKYIPVDFGIRIYQNRAAFEESLADLEPRDRDYILSLPWPLKTVWHIADERMSRISRGIH
jgi:hypothetical protein